MSIHMLKRRIAALGTVLGLGVALPFTLGVTPAQAQAQLDITKTHVGDFSRGGEGIYRITVINSGTEATPSGTRMTDVLPTGLTSPGVRFLSNSAPVNCTSPGGDRLVCDTGVLQPGDNYTLELVTDVAADAPCTITNIATVVGATGGISDSASDSTNIPGSNCNGGGGGGGSLLPISLSGVIPMFNNISTNTNINSPGATNTSKQHFKETAPTDQ
ncbi:hypothetical protein [Streptomyces sp. NBC_00316]|uniref:hypothetical protein n=1 Tax=Streptomyces sp. NBC_00316 TaxID=2975710 RepID=UPI002E2E58AC|nr:hypothetical protein [Streptomyces sp. NBC_00316]